MSQHDLIIRNGMVADGTGAEPVPGDLAINGGFISAIGKVQGRAAEEIDAAGNLVTPGFVDLHTHLDAQIGWDPMLTPISWHGVTTALMGNCGVTFAPCKPQDRELLAAMMETVEDIPRNAILSGLPWSWEDYGGYLDALDQINPAINVAGLVGHCAIRYYVMGDRSADDQPTAQELSQIARIAGDAVKAGAVGFSTNRFLGHYMPDGRHVPGTHATHEEVAAIATAVGGAGGLMQNVLNMGGDFDGEMSLLRKEAQASKSGRILFSVTAGARDTSGARVKSALEAFSDEGLDINAITVPRGTGGILGLQCGLPWSAESWRKLAAMEFDERLKAIGDAPFVATLVADAAANPGRSPEDLFWIGNGDQPSYTGGREMSLAGLAEAAGEHAAETFIRMARQSNGRTLFTQRMFNKNLKALENLFSNDRCLPSLGDAGAHVSQVMDSGWATFFLSHWTRDRGVFSVGQAVHKLTAAPARIIGLKDRGLLKPGMRADINVLDLNRLGEKVPEIVHDFPFGSPRFIQRGQGYQATICNGTVILRDDEHTGARAGEVLRNRG
ncbi:MAG: amidohydrolase family protein [Proteobacteria bacterium]|jgi:N-acyl-D-amino-acid deacylase|nr:amidohydrolase family protein [Pseudomonadota bacterium]MDA1298701.1 amidohydrolase family protein [Pseudomonadota bacterium]